MKIDIKKIIILIIVVLVGVPFCIGIFQGIADYSSDNTLNTSANTTNSIQETNSIEKSDEMVTFLKNTNAKEFFETLCKKADIISNAGTKTSESIMYANSNTKYGIEIESNKSNEINYINIYTLLNENYEDFFLTISDLIYNGSNKEKCYTWIKNNLGKETSTKIGDANIKLTLNSSGLPILELYTDGNEQFQKEQLNKLMNN